MFSTRQQLTKVSLLHDNNSCWALNTKQSQGRGLVQASAVHIPKWLFFEVMGSDVSGTCSANFKGLGGGHIVVLCFLKMQCVKLKSV